MKDRDKHARRKDQLNRSLEKLFYNKKFYDEIRAFRNVIGIPPNGFKTFTKYYKYLEKVGLDFHFSKIEPFALKIIYRYGFPSNYAYWAEAFLALGYYYEDFQVRVPFHRQRVYSVYGKDVALDTAAMGDGQVNLVIFPGATLNSVIDFVRENMKFIGLVLEAKENQGKAPAVRNVGQRDRLQILKLSELKEINSTGAWIFTGKRDYPACLKGIGPEQIKKIIAEERRKKKLREGKRK